MFSSLSFAFCHLINSIHDIEPIVAQKAISLIETLSEYSLKCIINCLQLQFDYVIADRTFLLKTFSILYTNLFKNCQSILTWDFFLQRFNAISIEHQLLKEILTPIDINGFNGTNNLAFQRKVNIAKIAHKQTEKIKHLNSYFNDTKQNIFKSIKMSQIFF